MIDLKIIFLLALGIELMTLFGRFVFKISSKEVLIRLMKRFNMKFVIHLHHGIIGLILSAIAYFYGTNFWFNFGLAMFLSDMIHHFIVLWFVVGNPEFHLVYKNLDYYKKEKKKEERKMNRFMKHLIHSI